MKLHVHKVDGMLENLATTGAVSSMNIKYLITLCHMPLQYKSKCYHTNYISN